MKKVAFWALALSALASCKKDQMEVCYGPDAFIFGHFYGECGGEECIEMFKIEDGKLYEDTNDTYPTSTEAYVGNWAELPQATYELVSDAMSQVPSELLAETDTVLGMPDAGDWGGLYIEYRSGNFHRYWLVDMMGDGYLAPFVEAVKADIQLINEN